MCGIAGVIRAEPEAPVDEQTLLRMAAAVRHRGPDGYGIALDAGAGLVSTRLAIFDIPRGWQPLELAGSASILVYNGEVYNHPELRAELERRGERFQTSCDTEVVLRLLELDGLAALDRFNGQFALAWWQPEHRRLTMVRDRFGIRPLQFAVLSDGTLVFGSEAKAIFASGLVEPRPDLDGLDDVFTTWGPRPPRTAFAGISQPPPGGLVVWERGSIVAERRWWTPRLGSDGSGGSASDGELGELLRDSVRLRLRADVPVGAYLSGGLDSSLITALAEQETEHRLRTFSVAFHDVRYDERVHQEQVATAIGTDHHVIEIGPAEIAGALPQVIMHTERPLVRTAPVPLFLLASAVRESGITVVATGEGADELFWGYDLFKEVAIRELAATDPGRAEGLLDDLYTYLGPASSRRGPAWRRFILETGAGADPIGSHLTRAQATSAVKAFYRPELAAAIAPGSSLERLRAEIPTASEGWSRLERAAWLELTTLLEPSLLAAQGDRVAMAHGVEGRFPFLDHRVFEYAARLPYERKLKGMTDKVVLRELAHTVLPATIADRPKQPYRAPGVASFFSDGAPDWVEEALSPAALADAGIWDPGPVAGLLRRCRAGRATGPREEMALIGVLSTQLWHQTFFSATRHWAAESEPPRVRIERPATISGQAAGGAR